LPKSINQDSDAVAIQLALAALQGWAPGPPMPTECKYAFLLGQFYRSSSNVSRIKLRRRLPVNLLCLIRFDVDISKFLIFFLFSFLFTTGPFDSNDFGLRGGTD
jgi:hypothetical protein